MGMGRGCNHFLHLTGTPFIEVVLKWLSLDFDRQNFFIHSYTIAFYADIGDSID